jgi:RNA polymerase sigma factor (sigma-70 family)
MTASHLASGPLPFRNNFSFDEAYLTRLRNGDEETAKHFYTYFKNLLRRWLWGKFTREQEEELIDAAITAAYTKISAGQPRQPARLPAYVTGICVNLTRLALRPTFNQPGDDIEGVQIADVSRNAEDRLLAQEKAREVRKVLGTLTARDRQILSALFYQGKHRDEVCQAFAIDREQLRLILFRARKRFQENWIEASAVPCVSK